MPLIEALPVGAGTAQWNVWGTVARVVVTDPALVPDAEGLVRDELAAVDGACSRFRDDAELRRACTGGPVTVSPLLAELVAAALTAARDTGGDVDPTVGGALCGLGYDRDFAVLTGCEVAPAVRIFTAPDWRSVRLRGRQLTVPAGVLLDLGATAKAVAADRAAARVAAHLGTGVLVALGGDIATAGPGPAGGWRVLVQDRPGDPACTVRLPAGAALATSSTASRTWGRPGELLHHIIDPRTGRPAARVWRTVSVAAFSCLRANTLSTAAVVRGHDAPALLGGAPSRLVTPGLDVLRLGGWPA
ncbi:FAD:protein FMN transferase [Paractinoplanes abujensis]|uniref:FAD:protein FMN transferase n=1 Tax=Paractinoplanes abujensis TaxID=882441 RepID=A0A7W7D1V4_9ACTN|nr:FAD:protein FMN transferase [Actinoplanes abujensis]MBB4697775.1 thiamine biosynthesis lipoprotein [Actinoplanes abujensis]GID19740.1 FAD:protein FMN transferase [Actinoplanes abujensis]